MSKKKEQKAQAALDAALKEAVVVNNDVELKTELGQKRLSVISNDPVLYEQLLQKFSKAQISTKGKTWGTVLTVLGAAITISTGGILWSVGVPMMGAGAAIGITGIALDDYKDYSIVVDYDKKQVIFLKTKGTPCIDLPSGYSLKKFSK